MGNGKYIVNLVCNNCGHGWEQAFSRGTLISSRWVVCSKCDCGSFVDTVVGNVFREDKGQRQGGVMKEEQPRKSEYAYPQPYNLPLAGSFDAETLVRCLLSGMDKQQSVWGRLMKEVMRVQAEGA